MEWCSGHFHRLWKSNVPEDGGKFEFHKRWKWPELQIFIRCQQFHNMSEKFGISIDSSERTLQSSLKTAIDSSPKRLEFWIPLTMEIVQTSIQILIHWQKFHDMSYIIWNPKIFKLRNISSVFLSNNLYGSHTFRRLLKAKIIWKSFHNFKILKFTGWSKKSLQFLLIIIFLILCFEILKQFISNL